MNINICSLYLLNTSKECDLEYPKVIRVLRFKKASHYMIKKYGYQLANYKCLVKVFPVKIAVELSKNI